jgi:hypothetical protein
MMEVRLLNAGEFPLLDEIGGSDKATLSPDSSIVAAVLEDGKIKGRLALVNLPHIEAAWIAPEFRNGTALARMESLLTEKLKSLGAGTVLALAVDEKMESYIDRLGYRKLATAWIKEI